MLTSHHGVDFLCHYLDDFFTLGPQASLVYHNNLQASIQLCSKLGLPLHPDKLEDLSTCLSILGIEQARLPTNKREWIIILLETWSGKRFCKQQELESLIGHLHHGCKIVPKGRTFLLSDVMTIQFTWTRNSVLTWLGGTNLSKVGMGSASS